MPRGLPRAVKEQLEKARECALCAVETYNRPAASFRSGAYICLMVMAWTALFHAMFFRTGKKPFYRSRTRKRRYERVDGDYKYWELGECLNQYYQGDNPPVRKNLEFFIGLRNKIEHRSYPALDTHIFGECQAMLLNFEAVLRKEFGSKYCLNESLPISLQFSQVADDEQSRARRALMLSACSSVLDYVEQFRNALPFATASSPEYCFQVYLVPKLKNKPSRDALAVEFVHYDPSNQEQMEEYERVTALIKEKTVEIPVLNKGLMKASQVARAVQARIPFRFSTNNHAKAWQHYRVRPPKGATDPGNTETRYCLYDELHRDYLYTQGWVDFLSQELSDRQRYKKITGMAPRPKDSGQD